MAHELDFNEAAQAYAMAYSGDVPWHGLGKKVPSDLTPKQMMKAANLDWDVELIPLTATWTNPVTGEKKKIPSEKSMLVRSDTGARLDEVGKDWNFVQNSQAFDFFCDFVANGDLEMHTAGACKGGQLVWALAKFKEGAGFTLFKKDKVEPYLLFTNPHRFAQSWDVRLTAIRAVCWNTVTAALGAQSSAVVRGSHRKAYEADEVKEKLGMAKEQMAKYKEAALFLSKKEFTKGSVVEYFQETFPVLTTKSEGSDKELSKSAQRALTVLDSQPGHQFGEGTWWQAFNAVTFCTDHLIGKSADNRFVSAHYGANRSLKNKALERAVRFAEAS